MAQPHEPVLSPPTFPAPPAAPAHLAVAALPALPTPPGPPSSAAISPSPGPLPTPSGSATPLPPLPTGGASTGKAPAGKNKADDPPDGEPKPKKKRSAKKPGEAGPGKSWRKGLKGNLAGVGLDPSVAASLHTAGTASPSGSSPAPARTAAVSGTTSAVGAPPRLNNQFVATHPLHIGTPRPRRWIKTKIAFKRVDGESILLPSWQGDSFSPFASTPYARPLPQRADFASPPPAFAAPVKARASTHVAGSHLMTPSLSSSGASGGGSAAGPGAGVEVGPLGYQAPRPPVLPPPPAVPAPTHVHAHAHAGPAAAGGAAGGDHVPGTPAGAAGAQAHAL